MPNTFFQFKQFTIHQDRTAMKVTTDSCLFGAWVASKLEQEKAIDKTALDIGAGTGLLSLMLAQKTSLHITSVEIDKDAFTQCSENSKASPWKERITTINTDIKKFNSQHRFDYIICNPPFYESDLQSPAAKRNLAHHSTDLTLSGLLDLLAKLLQESGEAFLLLPYKRKDEVLELALEKKLYPKESVSVRQSTIHSCFRSMICLSHSVSNAPTHTEISIRDEANNYTAEFTALLQDYYLYL